MNNTKIITKENELFGEVRFAIIDGKEYAIANDVLKVLGYAESGWRKTLSRKCKHVTKCHTLTSGGEQEVNFINEGDIYRLIVGSKLPEAEKFESWVFDEVLPQIRQTGGYIPIKEEMSDEEIMAKALLVAQKTIDKKNEIIQKQNKQLEEQKPMVEFVNAITESSDSIDMGKFAKLVKDEKVFIGGRNKLFDWLRNNGYLMKDNTPYQRYIDNKVFEFIEYTYKTPYGQKIGHKTLVTPKGQVYLVEKLRKEFSNK